MAEAEKALKPSWMSLKFAPDHLTASMEYTQAATKFRAAGLLADSVQAWLKAAQAKELQHDLFGAGRAYESAGAICDGTGPGGPLAAGEHWEKAIRCFRLSGKGEIAAKLLLKLAAQREKAGDIPGAISAYSDAIEVFEQDEKDYNLGDVYKQYIGFLVRSSSFEEAIKAIDGHIAVLRKQRHFHFVYKEALAKVVILLHLQDTVRAEDALNSAADVEGWFGSNESMAGAELVAAFQENDAETANRVLQEQVFTFLQVEVARMAKQLRVPTLAAPAPRPANTNRVAQATGSPPSTGPVTDNAGLATTGAGEHDRPTQDELGALLM